MISFILKRVGLAIITLFILSLIVFFAAQVLPGDPARAILGPLASAASVKALAHQLGTDKPVLDQYWTWISNVVQGHLGESYQYREAIGPHLTSALGNSLKLAAVAFVLVVPLGILGGVVAALNVGKPIDRIISVVGLSATVIPEVVSGIVLILIFAIGLNVLPLSASGGHGFGGHDLPPDHARDPADADPVRLHRADGPGGHGRGTGLRLRAHRHPQGPSPRGDDPPPRAAQLAAARRSPSSPPRPGI